MRVHVDEAGEGVHALDIQLAVVGLGLRPVLGIDRHPWRADTLDLDDAVALDDDIDRAARWRPGAVDQGSTAQDEPIEGPLALVPVGRCRDRLGLFVLCSRLLGAQS
jgi:hypothetical protein